MQHLTRNLDTGWLPGKSVGAVQAAVNVQSDEGEEIFTNLFCGFNWRHAKLHRDFGNGKPLRSGWTYTTSWDINEDVPRARSN